MKKKTYVDTANLASTRTVEVLPVRAGKVTAVRVSTETVLCGQSLQSPSGHWPKRTSSVSEDLVFTDRLTDFLAGKTVGNHKNRLVMASVGFLEDLRRGGYAFAERRAEKEADPCWDKPFTALEEGGDENRVILDGSFDHLPKDIDGDPLLHAILFTTSFGGHIGHEHYDMEKLVDMLSARDDVLPLSKGLVETTWDDMRESNRRTLYPSWMFAWTPSPEDWKTMVGYLAGRPSHLVAAGFQKAAFETGVLPLRDFSWSGDFHTGKHDMEDGDR